MKKISILVIALLLPVILVVSYAYGDIESHWPEDLRPSEIPRSILDQAIHKCPPYHIIVQMRINASTGQYEFGYRKKRNVVEFVLEVASPVNGHVYISKDSN